MPLPLKASFIVIFPYTGVTAYNVNLPDTFQTSNIYVPGLSRPALLPEERPAGGPNRGDRRYTDEEVAGLPFISREHPHYTEWVSRQASSRRLVRYLAERKKAAGILEIGCGNGWLSHQLSTVPGSRVVGLDVDFNVLQQAARVFRDQPNLKFIYGNFYSDVLQDLSFDIVVLAAVIHYFPSLPQVLVTARPYLRPRGEIHILDSPFTERDLDGFDYRYYHHPRSLWNRLSLKKGVHPWICVKG